MTIYALLVAVSEYPEGITDLPGCQNDLRAFSAFFADYARVNDVSFAPHTLLNATATRQGVIEAFQHFDQAGPDDICLFYYTGHGAQMPAPREFWDQSRDRRCETMVLHDSRGRGGRDLADKELSYLLAKHTQQAGHCLVIADSCHSGSISRQTSGVNRTVAPNDTPVGFADFLGAAEYKVVGEYRHPPRASHVTLSACRPEQVAMEMPIRGERRGLFTNFLLEVLAGADLAELSYREVMDRVRVRVRNQYARQDVYCDATGAGSLAQRFLNGSLKRSRGMVLDYAADQQWFINQGELSDVIAGTTARVLDGTTEREIKVLRTTAGHAFVGAADWLQPSQAPYPLLGIDKKGAPLAVYIDAKMSSVIRSALVGEISREAATLVLTDDPATAKYHLVHLPHYGVSAVLPGEERPVFESAPEAKPGWAPAFVEKLSKVATYEATLRLAPADASLPLDELVDLRFEAVAVNSYGDETGTQEMPTDGRAVFSYTMDETGAEIPPALRLTVGVRKSYPGELYVGMLYFDESFGVSGAALPVQRLTAADAPYPTRQTVLDADGQAFEVNFLTLQLPDVLQGWGLTEITNYLKVIVSETEFSLEDYEQEGLEQQAQLDADGKAMRGMAPGGIQFKKRRDRWAVRDIPFAIHRPMDIMRGVRMQGSDGLMRPVEMMEGPEEFAFSGMSMDSSLSTGRSVGTYYPPCPSLGYGMEPLSLVHTRSAQANEMPQDLLLLHGVRNEGAVTAATPLRLKTDLGVGMDTLAFAFDEESGRYYPVGFPQADGMMLIQQLPAARPEEYARSLGGSVKLFFRKVINDYLPWPVGEINKLRAATVNEALEVVYGSGDPAQLRQLVAAAEKPIALFVHGIIGDTTTAPAILRRASFADGSTLYERYDLLLTYDYENLKTPLADTALKLQGQLQGIGLGPGHGKTLHIYAHSMGGLVSRYFIEILTGKQVVQRLFQFGTPNGGSPYGNAAQWLTPLLSRALEGGAAYQPWLAPLLGLRWFINEALDTLQEMKIGSEFLKVLNEQGDRGEVPYHLVNGDIRLIPETRPEDLSFYQRILAKLDWKDAADSIFFQAPTDVAVAVTSQQAIPGLTKLPTPVGSDHMSYFVNAAAIERLEAYLPEVF
ncbi:caspase family protein [Neolewinella lacunae]|uniref:Caspase family protein n=1 Tax=Neolewinella lacunae TaxID=1517758 RepID=A0A923PGB1_9BACT|nr:caspase family protein [Neolewinella lacunae]MBC6993542.1 caspase family protein [Neolewinella lacunae]MDN3636182.1 caspase family protein [Neolewinella lacunae]